MRRKEIKNCFEPLNGNLLESGFDGQVFQVFMVTPVSTPNKYRDNSGKEEVFDMNDFGEPRISDDINDINNY